MKKFYSPTEVFFGIGSLSNLPLALDSYSNILVITGENSVNENQPFIEMYKLVESKVGYRLDGIPTRPDLDKLLKLIIEVKGYKFDAVLAVGGGSVIEIAKALVAFHRTGISNAEELREAINNRELAKNIAPIIAVATTAGAGSEVNSWSTIWDSQKGIRYNLGDDKLFPKVAIVDPRLTISVGRRLTASTGLDVLCHAVEGVWANKGNILTRTYAFEACKLVFDNLETAIKEPDNIDARDAMCTASILAGISLNVARTTVAHSMSYPLTMEYNMEHGIACAITLGEVYKYNKGSIPDEKGFELLITNRLGGVSLPDYIDNIFHIADIPNRLSQYGMQKEGLADVAKRGFTHENVSNNPKILGENELLKILEKVF